mgnify:CR=1 FL=1|jgi:hypothetical protein
MREAIKEELRRCGKVHLHISVAISGNQWYSVAISGTQ